MNAYMFNFSVYSEFTDKTNELSMLIYEDSEHLARRELFNYYRMSGYFLKDITVKQLFKAM